MAPVAQGFARPAWSAVKPNEQRNPQPRFYSGTQARLPHSARTGIIDRRLPLKFRFRRFRSRLLVLFVALLTLLQTATYLLVRQANRQHAMAEIDARLRTGAQIFMKLIEQRN